ncbi:MAG: DUF1256 domain-containing protein [Clostridia bacterium]|nr:DUF1256 domain-containing protein [Clostridia bacterium]
MFNKVYDSLVKISIMKKLETIGRVSQESEIVFLCIGNPKVWYDSFGPMFGSFLKSINIKTFVYGDIDNPITINNIDMYISAVKKFHVKPFIIVIDVSLSNGGCNGVKIVNSGLNIGFLSNKSIYVGDMAITYVFDAKNIKKENRKNMIVKIKEVSFLLKEVLENKR